MKLSTLGFFPVLWSLPLNLAPILNIETKDIIPNQWIVHLKESVEEHEQFIQSFDSSEQELFQIVHKFQMGEFQGYSIKLEETLDSDNSRIQYQAIHPVLMKIRKRKEVLGIEPDQKVKIEATQLTNLWNLQRISQRNLPTTNAYYYDDIAGAGVDIYILDTGIMTRHVDFGGRAKFGISFNGEPHEPEDANGHGTHVAGIAGSNTFGITIKYLFYELGVSKNANLIAVRVLGKDGTGSISNVIAAIQWTINEASQTRRPSIINLSLNGGSSNALKAAVVSGVKQDIHFTIAAGNDAIDACKSSPANSQTRGATVVASFGPNNVFSDFSNNGRCVNILAPGENIKSTYINPDGYPITNSYSASMSGTSMSSPHVAGVKALYLAKRKYKPLELQTILLNDAVRENIINLPKTKGHVTTNAQLYNNPPKNRDY